MENPKDVRYTKEHEWVKMDNDIAIVGITDFAQHQLTDIVYIELPEVGKLVVQMGNLCVIESVKSVSDVFSPVSGEVIEVNRELIDKPELINEDPYARGWIAKIRCVNKGEFNSLMTDEEYDKYIKRE